MRHQRNKSGFTLLEVMFALSILFASLVGLLWKNSRNVRDTGRAKFLTVATNLARLKMYDIEEELLHDGFQDTAEEMEGDFDDEGFRKFEWHADVEKVKLPSAGDAQNLLGDSSGPSSADQGAKGGLGGFGGTGGSDPTGMGLGAVMSQFEMIRGVLENAIRKVTLTVTWKVGKRPEKLVVVCYFTDPKAVNEALAGAPSP